MVLVMLTSCAHTQRIDDDTGGTESNTYTTNTTELIVISVVALVAAGVLAAATHQYRDTITITHNGKVIVIQQ